MSNDTVEIGNLKQKSPIKVGKFHRPNNLESKFELHIEKGHF
ncbi:MAG: hypothetical protein ACTHKJ_02155 [Candidatus Nitrosocosmicus sp.]